MAHEVHTTPAYILLSRDLGEASKILTLFSRDYGIIRGVAQGVRFNKSKLRYSLSEFSRPRISLVRGREYWRIVGAVPSDPPCVTPFHGEAFKLYVRVLSLLRQLAPLEEENTELFEEVEIAFRHLQTLTRTEELENFEVVLILRVLKNLGYLGETPDISRFTHSFTWSSDLIEEVSPVRALAIRTINESLALSQLV